MPIPTDVKNRLAAALETGNLVLLCGAGLSMPAPSRLPSAASVAEQCFDRWSLIEILPSDLRHDIEGLAGLFYDRGDFVRTFIEHVVPWNDLVGRPNSGHGAVADFLICRAVHSTLTSNFDALIEGWAGNHKLFMQGALDGVEAVNFQQTSSPLLKFHGCMQRRREQTVWTGKQFSDPVIRERVELSVNWMRLNLPGRDLVVIGFWTDWAYLNRTFADAFGATGAASVTLVNPEPTVDLRNKAPELWDKLNAATPATQFAHVQMSSEEFLTELRQEFSDAWYRKLVVRGRTLHPLPAGGPTPVAGPPGLNVDDLYDLRRDMQAMPYTHHASLREPELSAAEASSIRLKLHDRGATGHRSWLRLGGESIRVINGAGRALQDVLRKYKEPPTSERADVIVCAGAIDLGVPTSIVGKGTTGSFVRPASGSGSLWITSSEADTRFGL